MRISACLTLGRGDAQRCHAEPLEECALRLCVDLPVWSEDEGDDHAGRVASVDAAALRYALVVCNLFIPALAHCALQRRIAFAGGDARDIDDTVERGDEEVPVRALVTEGDLRLPLCPMPHAGEDAAQVIQDSGVCPCAPAFVVARVCVIELPRTVVVFSFNTLSFDVAVR